MIDNKTLEHEGMKIIQSTESHLNNPELDDLGSQEKDKLNQISGQVEATIVCSAESSISEGKLS